MAIVHVHYYCDSEGTEWFSKFAARKILGVTKNTLKSYLRMLLGSLPDYLPTPTLQVLFQMQIWLKEGAGKRSHSKGSFMMRLRTNTLEREFHRLCVPIKLHLQNLETKIQSARQTYGNHQTSHQVSTAITISSTAIA